MSQRWARIGLVVAGLALAGSGLSGVSAPAGAAGAVRDGSDWGSLGTLSSDSAVTVRWDNAGNPAGSVVPRDGRQLVPHTAGKTYDDIDAKIVNNPYAAHFHDLAVSVSQTRDLVNQAVTIDVKGAVGGPISPGADQSGAYFQVFQCWGGLTAAGRPDPAAANPDPATCQVGAGGPDFSDAEEGQRRRVTGDLLTLGGDWDAVYRNQGYAPYVGINGEKVDGQEGKNTFFNRNDTNELSNVTVSEAGSAQRQFEIQTTQESYGLGCGKRAGVASTRSCWLVVVPRVLNVLRSAGPISPSLWAQRLQVRLDFRNVAAGCPGGKARTPIGGSELLLGAAESWVPGLCEARDIDFGYSRIADPVARLQYDGGTNDAIAASQAPHRPSVAVPVALAAPVVTYQLTYLPTCATNPATTDEDAQARCHYASVAEQDADHRRTGTPVRELRLNARIVAKLLTQSYSRALLREDLLPWGLRSRPQFLLQDPEFKRLNPKLVHLSSAVGLEMNHVMVEAMRSDAATRVWQWIMADPDGRAFMSGCPDPDGMIVNPYYSTRTYEGCADQREALAAQADADRESKATKADTYVDVTPSYPPTGSPYPLVTWQETPATEDKAAYTLIDMLPPVDSMQEAGRYVARGLVKTNKESDWCPSYTDVACEPAPGKYRANKLRQNPTRFNLVAIADSATAARWRLPTAELCDGDTAAAPCVGATAPSLRAAAADFATDAGGWVVPGDEDIAGGAYPLTLPVYAAVDPTLPYETRTTYANGLEFITTQGQTPGFEAGELPPGYAPLTPALRVRAETAISELRTGAPHVVRPPGEEPSDSGDPDGGDDGDGTGTTAGDTPTAGAAGDPPAGATDTPPPGTTAAQVVTVAASTETWGWWTVPLGLLVALLAGFGGPIMRLRGKFTVSR